jgi:hypothetical protein
MSPRCEGKPTDAGRLPGDGFEVETLIHVRVAKAGLKVTEVPSYEYSRIHGVSNLNAVRDGVRVMGTILAGLDVRDRPDVAPSGLSLAAPIYRANNGFDGPGAGNTLA